MRSLRIALLAASMFSVVSLQAQTVDEIINKYFEALGGKDKVASIKTTYIEADMDMMGNAVSGSTWAINGKGVRTEAIFMGQKMIQCFTDTGGWKIMPFMGQTSPVAVTADELKANQAQFDLTGPFFNYAAKGNTIELLGKDTLDGKAAYKLKITNKYGVIVTTWIDAATWYVLKNSSKTQVKGVEVESNASFSNYKKTENGYVMPFNAEMHISTGLNIYITNKKIEVNKEIDSTMFQLPKQ